MYLHRSLTARINNLRYAKRFRFELSKLGLGHSYRADLMKTLSYCFGYDLFYVSYSPLGIFYPSGSPGYIIEERKEGADVVGRFMELDGSSLILHQKFEYQSSKYSEMYFGKFGKKPLIQLADSFSYV